MTKKEKDQIKAIEHLMEHIVLDISHAWERGDMQKASDLNKSWDHYNKKLNELKHKRKA